MLRYTVIGVTAQELRSRPWISHHLKVLVDAGIFTRGKRGVWAYCALRPSALRALTAMLRGDPDAADLPRPGEHG